MSKRKTLNEFIKDCIAVHGDKYDYSNTVYINNCTKVEIICEIHGSFFMYPTVHINKKSGCTRCSGKAKKTTLQFINESKEIHGDKFSYINTNYTNNSTKVDIVCNTCNSTFTQLPTMHLQGQGCPSCYGNKKIDSFTFYRKCKEIHNEKYEYLNDFTGYKNIVTVVCKKHGNFKQLARSHYNGHGCPSCGEFSFKPYKKAFFYVQEISDKNDELISYKIGITNRTPKQRLSQQTALNNFKQKVIFSFSTSGYNALMLEKHILDKLEHRHLSKVEFPDGYTETIRPDLCENLENLIINFIINLGYS